MLEWLENVAGPQYVPAILWTLGALVALVVVLLIVRAIRGMSSGTYVAGGRNRKTRLAIMDATAVDSHRRLVLIRRDDVEHLILIGGGNDLLVESNIRLGAPVRRPEPAQAPQQQAPRPRPPESAGPAPQPQQRPPSPQPAVAARPAAPPQPPSQPSLAPRPVVRPQPAPAAPPQPAPASRQSNAPMVTPVMPPRAALPAPSPVIPSRNAVDDLDQSLLDELEVTLDGATTGSGSAKAASPSLEDEMARLLGELSTPKK